MFTAYNPKDCVITVEKITITGLGEDMVSCEKDEDNVSTAVGAQGDVVLNVVNNPLGTITLTVQGTSPQLKHLIGLANSSKIVPIWVNNKPLKIQVGGEKAIIKKVPTIEQSAELSDMEFEFQVLDYTVKYEDKK